MSELFQTINIYLKYFVITGFALYSLFFFIVRYFSKEKEALIQFDATACKIIIYVGILFGIVWIAGIFSTYLKIENEFEYAYFSEMLTGSYWFSFWMQFIIVVLFTQLLRIKLLKHSIHFRSIISLIFIISYEKVIIWITYLHRDYLPSTWNSSIPVGTILLDFLIKIVLFVVLVSIVHFSLKKITNKNSISRG